MSDIELERGLCWWFDNVSEIKAKEIPEERSHALAFEAGREAGRCEYRENVVKVFKPERGIWA